MRERKMFFPPALRLAAVAIALSAAALALPLPVFAVLDRAAGHSIAVQQDAEALSPAGRSCAAARELCCRTGALLLAYDLAKYIPHHGGA